ncbi:MAG: GNAT family N-acetyltransferase [Pelagibacterales bacterium]|nr:GNAT family N-acetyltransferase [Pelagibacterales bacterium]
MITEYMKKDVSNILSVINNAALKYKGVIPDNCWHEPYMSEEELLNEFDSGVRMFGYKKNNILVGVMGIQELKDITLIRHAYTFSTYQGMGIGKLLLQYLFRINKSSILYVGTWKEATWAIQFYEKFGFVTHKRKKTIELLKKHWKVSLTQIENSVILEK